MKAWKHDPDPDRCPDCGSQDIHSLDLITREMECSNCGYTWFDVPDEDYEPPEPDMNADYRSEREHRMDEARRMK